MDGHVQVAGAADLQATLYAAGSMLHAGRAALAIDHYRWAGAQFTARGEVHDALAVYAVVGRLLPHCLHTQGMIAELHRRLGRCGDAARIYERIAEAHLTRGRVVEAAHVYRLIVEIDPTTVLPRVRLAELYAILGQPAQAVQQLEVAAGQLLAGGRIAEYLSVAEQLLALDPSHVATLRGVVAAWLRQRELRRAVAWLRYLLRLRRCDDVGRELLADCLAAHGRPARAAIALRLLGEEVRRRGVHAYDEAKRLLVRAVRENPYDRVAQESLRALEAEIAEVAKGCGSRSVILSCTIERVNRSGWRAGRRPDPARRRRTRTRRSMTSSSAWRTW